MYDMKSILCGVGNECWTARKLYKKRIIITEISWLWGYYRLQKVKVGNYVTRSLN